ncbi:MAG TPA: hypothetical protein VFV40_06955, partial [Nocardioides sp.]|nr:hypothetical protein [Nocardioides sp.]
MHHLRGRPRGTLVRRGVAAVLVASVGLAAAGCTGDDEPSSPAYSRGATSTLEPRPAAPEVRVTRVAGRLSRQDREALADRVGTVVAAYYEDAYLGG